MWNKILHKYQELKEAWNVRKARKARIISLIAEMNQEVTDAVDAETKSQSPWWKGIGPVYSIDGTAKRLNLSTTEVENLIQDNKLLAVQAADTGAWFVPCAQLINGGTNYTRGYSVGPRAAARGYCGPCYTSCMDEHPEPTFRWQNYLEPASV